MWDPLSSNKTSASELTALTQNYSASAYYYTTQDYKLGLDGKAFDLPGGPVNIAIGGELTRNSLNIQSTKANSTGPVTPINGASFTELGLKRSVTSAYGEVLIPLVGPDMDVPYISKFDIDISGRYDLYADLGSTFNPKFGADWGVVDGLKLHASYGTSFVEPNIVIVGDRSRTGPGGIGGGFTTFTGYSTASSSFTVPQAYFPLAASVPGATCASGTCSINGGVAQGISFNGGSVVAEPGKEKLGDWPRRFSDIGAWVPCQREFVQYHVHQWRHGNVPFHRDQHAVARSSHLLSDGSDAGADPGDYRPLCRSEFLPVADLLHRRYSGSKCPEPDRRGSGYEWNYQYDTDTLGSFSTGGAWTQFLLFNQHTTGAQTFSILGTTGYNNTFPSVAGQGRLNVGWVFGGFSAKLYGNFTSGYRNWSSSTVNPVILSNGYPTSGGDIVHSNLTFDAHLSYTIDRSDIMGVDLEGSQVFLDVVNLTDKAPVFYNGASGYDLYTGNPIGRVITVGLRANF